MSFMAEELYVYHTVDELPPHPILEALKCQKDGPDLSEQLQAARLSVEVPPELEASGI